MNLNSQVAALDRSIADNTKHVELAKALERLESNRDFRKIIGDGFFKENAVRLVHAKAEPAMQSPEKQAAILRDMDAIGTLAEFFRTIRIQGDVARNSIEDAETDRAELLKRGE